MIFSNNKGKRSCLFCWGKNDMSQNSGAKSDHFWGTQITYQPRNNGSKKGVLKKGGFSASKVANFEAKNLFPKTVNFYQLFHQKI